MKIGHVLRNTRGFAKATASALKWRSMRNKAEVERSWYHSWTDKAVLRYRLFYVYFI